MISEFSLVKPATQAQQKAFFAEAIPWLDKQAYVVIYFPFVATSPTLLQGNDGAAVNHVGTGGTLFNVSLPPVTSSLAGTFLMLTTSFAERRIRLPCWSAHAEVTYIPPEIYPKVSLFLIIYS